MAEVFLARAVGIGGFERMLCVKRVLEEHANDTELLEHLIDEAKLVSRIAHPNVAQVFDLGKVGDQLYIAMEWVDGVDALKLLTTCDERGFHVPVAAAAYIVMELARGLHAAHTTCDETGRPLGIVHRDVTPSNVLLSFEGQVKLIDFGVAKNLLRARQTRVGVVKGKYNYLAPEQARGEPVDPRTDVFAAGILLYELLCGEPLYPGTKAADVVAKARAAKIPSMRSKRADIPAELEAIARRALAKNRNERTDTAGRLAEELERFLTANAPDFGASQLGALLAYLFPNEAAAAIESDPMSLDEFVAHREVSLVTAPGVLVADDDFDAAPTRVASPEEIAARRAARAEGRVPTPPPVLPPRARPSSSVFGGGRFLLVFVGAGLVALLGAAGWAAVKLRGEPRVTVRSTPTGAFVAVDGLGTGQATPTVLRLARGRHDLVLTLDGYEDQRAMLEVEDDTTLEIVLSPARASLEVVSEPPGAMVTRGGSWLGTTPLVLRELSVGEEVDVELTAAGFSPLRYRHRVERNRAERVVLRLEPSP